MVEMNVVYEGQLHCRATHQPSGSEIGTDAPKDNMGKGEAFSPTDLVGAALATCILTTMGIAAQRLGVDMAGATAKVTKEMTSQPPRRIGELAVTIKMPRKLDDETRQRLEQAAHACPVHRSLHPEVRVTVDIAWG
jgi:putative redox protein